MTAIRSRAVALVAVAVIGMAPAAVAKHPAAGNCKHSHDNDGDTKSLSRCSTSGAGPLLGQSCTVDGKKGTCALVTRGCQCRTEVIDYQLALLNSVHEALETASRFGGTLGAQPGTEASAGGEVSALACAQLAVLASTVVYDSEALFDYGLIRYNDAKLLGRLDEVLLWLPTVHNFAIACALNSAPLFPPLVTQFLALKLGVLNSQNFRVKLLDTPIAQEAPPD